MLKLQMKKGFKAFIYADKYNYAVLTTHPILTSNPTDGFEKKILIRIEKVSIDLIGNKNSIIEETICRMNTNPDFGVSYNNMISFYLQNEKVSIMPHHYLADPTKEKPRPRRISLLAFQAPYCIKIIRSNAKNIPEIESLPHEAVKEIQQNQKRR